MSTLNVSAPATSTCPPPPQGSGCAEGYTAACLSIHAQLHPRTTTFGLDPSQTGSATPITHTLCCPRTFHGYEEDIFTFTCGIHPEVHTWSVCHSVVQERSIETWPPAAASNTASPVTTTWLPGDHMFLPPIAPQEIVAHDIDCVPAPATSTGPQTLPTLPTTPIQTSSGAATEGTPATTQTTPTTTPVPAGAAGMRDGTTSLKTAVGFVFFALLGVAAL